MSAKILESGGDFSKKGVATKIAGSVLAAMLVATPSEGVASNSDRVKANKLMNRHYPELSKQVKDYSVYDSVSSDVNKIVNADNLDTVLIGNKKVVVVKDEGEDEDVTWKDMSENIDQELLDEIGVDRMDLGRGAFVSQVVNGDRGDVMGVSSIQAKKTTEEMREKGLPLKVNEKEIRDFITAHELGHVIFSDDPGHQNEFFADVYAMKYMVEQGHSQSEAFSFLKTLREKDEHDHKGSYHYNPFEYDVLEEVLEREPNYIKNATILELKELSGDARLAVRSVDVNSIDREVVEKGVEAAKETVASNKLSIVNYVKELHHSKVSSFSFKKKGLTPKQLREKLEEDMFGGIIVEQSKKTRKTERNLDLLFKEIEENYTDENGYVVSDLKDSFDVDRFVKRVIEEDKLSTSGIKDESLKKMLVEGYDGIKPGLSGEKERIVKDAVNRQHLRMDLEEKPRIGREKGRSNS